MIDLNILEESLTDEKVIELLAFLGNDEYINKNDCIIFKTICHNVDPEDASLKLYYYKKNHRFVCYTECGDSFNIYTLFERRYKLLGIKYNFYKDIILKISDGNVVHKDNTGFYSVYESNYDKYRKTKPLVNLPHYNKNILNIYTSFATPEWLEDGISEEVMNIYNIKYSIVNNKIIIPHYDIDNNLIGIRGRALNENDLLIGKYMPVQIEGYTYSHPLSYNLYGLNVVKDNIKKYELAIVAESEKSALQYMTMFGKDKAICVACCGSSFHRYQLDLLLSCGAKKVLIAFDKEGETWEKRQKYYILQNQQSAIFKEIKRNTKVLKKHV